MKSKPERAAELEAELMRLNILVRARRKQLARLERCPNKDCECRMVWRDSVEKSLAEQMGRIRRQVKGRVVRRG
ncbi:MAG TPA: hypothetical protein VJA21_32720 [Verrucomicrobiae bacterium]